jgi:hypothetical protein
VTRLPIGWALATGKFSAKRLLYDAAQRGAGLGGAAARLSREVIREFDRGLHGNTVTDNPYLRVNAHIANEWLLRHRDGKVSR